MSSIAVWIDSTHAKVFKFSQEQMERKAFESHTPNHHTHPVDSRDIEIRERKLFQQVADELTSARQILILGPGIAKHHFQNFLNEHQPILSRKVVGCETVGDPTDPQIAAQAMKFFKIASPIHK